jgi:hypothetical protein
MNRIRLLSSYVRHGLADDYTEEVSSAESFLSKLTSLNLSRLYGIRTLTPKETICGKMEWENIWKKTDGHLDTLLNELNT